MNSAANAMPIRRIDFGFDDDIDLIFFDGDPVLSYSSHAFWMTMPYLEPYLMRSVRAAVEDVQDPNLKEEMSRFCSQEGQHFQQHAKVNAILKSRFDEEGQQKLQRIEEELEAEFQHFSVEKDHAFNLAYAEAFECMTMSMSRTQMEMAIHERMKAPIKDLFLWHITEEMEHRTVAFDAYGALGKGYLYRIRLGRWAEKHYLGYVDRFHRTFLALDQARIKAVETEQMIYKRKKFATRFALKYLPRKLATYLPWYHPSRVSMPDTFETHREHYSGLAINIK